MKAIITLRSGKEIEQPVPMTAEETCKENEVEPERVIISEDPVKKNMLPPFPQALRGKKKIPNQAEIWEVLRQVKVNIPLLYMIKQVPTYLKIFKLQFGLCEDQTSPISLIHSWGGGGGGGVGVKEEELLDHCSCLCCSLHAWFLLVELLLTG